ncbi:MAG: hypothetical protein ACHQ4F_09190 [Candidatus Dormibacteria bacterium]
MYRAGRTAWGLVAVGAATAVGITTRDPGFIVITFLGTLVLPRVLGLTPRRRNWRGFGPGTFGPRGKGWGGGECTGRKASEPEASTATPQSA